MLSAEWGTWGPLSTAPAVPAASTQLRTALLKMGGILELGAESMLRTEQTPGAAVGHIGVCP